MRILREFNRNLKWAKEREAEKGGECLRAFTVHPGWAWAIMARKNSVSVCDGEGAAFGCVGLSASARVATHQPDEVKEKLMEWIVSVAAFSGVEVWGFTVMDNHLHLIVHVPPVPERHWLEPNSGDGRGSDKEVLHFPVQRFHWDAWIRAAAWKMFGGMRLTICRRMGYTVFVASGGGVFMILYVTGFCRQMQR